MGLVDPHSHPLPGIDDGARDLPAAIALCQRLRAQGVTDLVATPHWCSPRFDVQPPGIEAAWTALSAAVATDVPGLSLHLGSEHHLSGLQAPADFVATVRPFAGTTLCLVELPDDHLPTTTWDTLFELRRAGLKPIIAHPERCKGLSPSDPRLTAFADAGGLLQVTLGHLAGRHGWIMRWKANRLWKRYRSRIILGSDAHNLGARAPSWDALRDDWRTAAMPSLAAIERY